LPLVSGAGFLGIEVFTPPWDVVFLPLFNLLVWLYQVIFSDLALAIVVFTVMVRFILWPLFVRQIQSQKEMQRMQPLVREVQRKHKGNRQKIMEETQALYREHGVNQFGGCLPLLLQMPILISLYSVLNRISSVVTYQPPDNLKEQFTQFLANNPAIQAVPGVVHQYRIEFTGPCNIPTDFHQFLPLNCQLIDPVKLTQPIDTTIGWLFNLDLARIDTVFSLPVLGVTISALAILTGVLQFVQAKMTTPPANPDDPASSTAATMLYVFPVMMVVWGAFLPSGLILYYAVLTATIIVQQFLIMGWGNLFPLFGWRPRFAPVAETSLLSAPRTREPRSGEPEPASATARSGGSQSSTPRQGGAAAGNRPRTRRPGQKRRGRRR
jgi:YidC/Oxa1 family membrane protein insertase